MNTKGKVHVANPPRGRVAVQTGDGFTIIEVTKETDFRVGDEVQWTNGTDMGSQTYRNVTTRMDVLVVVQNHWVVPEQLRQQLLLD
jgi:hypothetical protein